MEPRGGVLFGHFFGPAIHADESPSLNGLAPSKAVLITRFGHLGLITGGWKPIGQVPEWDRAVWRMPDFVHPDPFGKSAPELLRYSDLNPNQLLTRMVVRAGRTGISDGVSGAGYVESVLTKILIQ
jgi:hypothetical protein